MRRFLLPLLLLAVLAGEASAEIALLRNGHTLKLDSHRLEDGQLILQLRGGGELGIAPGLVQGFVPDEIVDELAEVRGRSDAEIRELASAVASRHGLDPELVLAVVAVESGFRPRAVSPKGAQGLMQLMPSTASSLGVTDAFDPEQNLDGGTRHLGLLLNLYGGDLKRALAAYNAGQGAVARHKGVPPYAETQAYVKKVLARYNTPARPARSATGASSTRGRKTARAVSTSPPKSRGSAAQKKPTPPEADPGRDEKGGPSKTLVPSPVEATIGTAQ